MGRRGSFPARAQPPSGTALAAKKNSRSRLLDQLEPLFCEAFQGCQARVAQRLARLGLSSLACFGRHHLSGWIQASGEGALDWSGAYRLFSRARFDPAALFAAVRRGLLPELGPNAPLVVAMDDTLVRRGGRKTPGVAWRRDPLGPPFHTNFVRAQRFVGLSAALPQYGPTGPARLLPLAFVHAPTATRPPKKAPPEQHALYRQQQRQANINHLGAAQIAHLRQALDDDGEAQRPLSLVVDNRFTNAKVLKNLPPRTSLIGRLRADAQLCFPPDPHNAARTGRRRIYGERAPSPAELLADESVPVRQVTAFAAGRLHQFPVKTIGPVMWRSGAGPRLLRLLVIKPLRYRLSNGSRLLYRQPAFLAVTDPDMPLDEAVQRYVWRWEIEVNFRDEKTVFGVGDPQVFNPEAVERAPQFQVGLYALLLLAARRAFSDAPLPDAVPPPKWRQRQPKLRASTQDLVRQLRHELWGDALHTKSFCRVRPQTRLDRTRQKLHPSLAAAVLSASP
jgi:hypothetical protein